MQELASNPWSKWWWLRIDRVLVWSPEEYRAAGAFYLTQAALWVFWFCASLGLTLGLHVPLNWSFGMSLAVATTLSLSNVRQVAGDCFPSVVPAGDAASIKRLGGSVPSDVETTPVWSVISRLLSTLFPWWYPTSNPGRLSREENRVMVIIFIIASVPLLAPLSFEIRTFQSLELSKWIGALIFLVHFQISLRLGRWVCALVFPDLVKRADELAYARLHG